jgi:hypothetical protein
MPKLHAGAKPRVSVSSDGVGDEAFAPNLAGRGFPAARDVTDGCTHA